MRNTSNVVFGAVLLAIGALWLAKSLDMFHFYWSDLFNYWYWFLIAAGVLLVVSGTTRSRAASSVAGILITLAIVGGVTRGAHREFRNLSPFEWKSGKDRITSRDNKRERIRKRNKGELVRGAYGYDMQPDLKEADLNFVGGAGVFTIGGSSTRLFEANTSSTFVNYYSNIRHNTADQTATVDFKMEEGNFDFDTDNGDNTVNIQLNDSVSWNVDLKFGAGEGKFDFSKNIVKKLELKSGAADITLKLGDRAENAEINVKSGMANVEIEVPKTVAVEIFSKGALSSTEFPGFEKKGKGSYRSPDYDEAAKKITIHYKAGLSNLKIERY